MTYEPDEHSRPEPGQPAEAPAPPTVPNLQAILVRAFELGNIEMRHHFVEKCKERVFSTLDAEQILESGTIVSGPTYDEEHHSYKCELVGDIDGKPWKLVCALDCNSDFCSAPSVALVTVHRMSVQRVRRRGKHFHDSQVRRMQ